MSSSESTTTASGPSKRRMTRSRRLYYRLGLPVLSGILRLLWRTYRVSYLPAQTVTMRQPPKTYCAPSYWHQDHVLCAMLIRAWLRRGFKAGFLVSDSVDGIVPARLAASWGAEIVRGSANRTGAAAMRDLREFAKGGTAIVTTADGPLGPLYEFKPGVALTAGLVKAPILPIAVAAERAWYLRRWDRFMVPKPFSRVVLAVGAPLDAPENLREDTVVGVAEVAQQQLRSLKEQAEAAFNQ